MVRSSVRPRTMRVRRGATFGMAALAAAIGLVSWAASGHAADISLYGYGFHVDGANGGNQAGPAPVCGVSTPGTTTGLAGSIPAGVNLSGFDSSQGLGVARVTVFGDGAHSVGIFTDHEIDECDNSNLNEIGSAHGTPTDDPGPPATLAAATESWEIDDPGYGLIQSDLASLDVGPIFDTDYTNGDPTDISLAMGWNVVLDPGFFLRVDFHLQTTAPVGTFYLQQYDPASHASIYLWSDYQVLPVTEPATLTLFAVGAMGLYAARRRKTRASLR